MKRLNLAVMIASTLALSACSGQDPDPAQYGNTPKIPAAERALVPSMEIAEPAGWDGQQPVVPQGYTISAIATDLMIPRQMLILPNGDILVAEGKGGHAPKLKPKDIIATKIKAAGTSSVKSGNRLTLLRDADADGKYELRTVFADKLDAPYGLAFANSKIYVAEQGALLSFDYVEGATRAAAAPVTLTMLPSVINHHWTKSLAVSPDGRFLYVGIGSNSNVGERGLDLELNRAEVWEVDSQTGAHRPFVTGIRNPTALTIQPGTNIVWAVVNERDELGPNLVPDYLTALKEGAFYGWPYAYWGQHVDERVMPRDPKKVATAVTPDYSLGSHRAALGVAFSNTAMGGQFADGAFVGEHGSWNRDAPVGYKVVFVPFSNGKPVGDPIDFVTNFRGKDGKTRGRPVGVAVDPKGALIIADDLSNTVWRVTPKR